MDVVGLQQVYRLLTIKNTLASLLKCVGLLGEQMQSIYNALRHHATVILAQNFLITLF